MLKVISASRRIDLAGGFPDRLVELLRDKAPPETVHTVVLWTKNPANLLRHNCLRSSLRHYRNLFLHLSITGMGGSIFECNIPPMEEVFKMLPELTDLFSTPEHIRIRFDPIVHFRMPDGSLYTNIRHFPQVARAAAEHGIPGITTSWMTVYKKVVRNLTTHGITPVEVSGEEWSKELHQLRQSASRNQLALYGCSVPGMEQASCIDGKLFMRFHPDNLPCSGSKAKDQRNLCGCTESFDIGWYNPYPHGCLYCYANPKISI